MRRMVETRQQLVDDETRAAFANELRTAYEGGTSIRALAEANQVAFGTVRSLLLEAGASLRPRGGPNHRRRQPNDQ